MTRAMWALWVLLMLSAAWLTSAYVMAGIAPPDPLEDALSSRGLIATRAAAGAAAALAGGDEPSVILLVDNGIDLGRERAYLGRYVAQGGHVIVMTIRPEIFSLGGGPTMGAYPGRLYASDGTDAIIRDLDGEGHAARGSIALRLDERDEHIESLWTADADAFRDSNANGRLDAGEPSGPFVVAARSRIGDGTLVVIGAPSLRALPVAALIHLLPADLMGVALLVDAENPGSTAFLRASATVATFPLTHRWTVAFPLTLATAALTLLVRAAPPSSEREPIERAARAYLAAQSPERTTHDRAQ